MLRIARLVALASVLAAAAFGNAFAEGILHEGDAAPAFMLPRASGGNVKLSDFHGKGVYLNFFATWCGPCNEEAPSVATLYKKYHARGLNIVAMNEYEDKDKALGFAAKYKWAFPIAIDDGSVGRDYGTLALPVHVFIGKDGKVSTFRLGEMSPAEIEAAIKKIL